MWVDGRQIDRKTNDTHIHEYINTYIYIHIIHRHSLSSDQTSLEDSLV